MKRKVYLRISNETSKMEISTKPKVQPLHNGSPTKYGGIRVYYPTIQICLNLDLPEEAFNLSQKEIDIKIKEPNPLSEINVEEDLK